MYETFEHTADLGLRVRAADLNTLFAEAGRGLFSMIVENIDDVLPVETRTIEISGTQRDYLLFDWLNELLYVSDTERLVFSQFDVSVGSSGLSATVRGQRTNSDRHHLSHEVKAITYHHLKLEESPEGFQAEVIVDI